MISPSKGNKSATVLVIVSSFQLLLKQKCQTFDSDYQILEYTAFLGLDITVN